MKLLKKIFGGWILFTIITSFIYLLAFAESARTEEDIVPFGPFYLACGALLIGIILLGRLIEFAWKLINGKI